MAILDEVLLLFKANVDGTGFNKLNNQIKSTHGNIMSMKNGIFSVGNLFRGFIGYDVYTGLKQFGESLVQSTKDLGAMTSRFYAITKSEKAANDELQWSFELARKTAMGLKATADSYSIFYAATQKGLGTGGARQVFQDWTEVSRVLHLSEYQFERVTYALREMASKGAIYSQDLRMQIGTHVPNAMGLAEKAANDLGFAGTSWFDNFQKAAKGNQKLINQFIVLFSKYAKETYASSEAMAKAMEQPDAQLNKLKNTWLDFQLAIAGGRFKNDLIQILKILNFLLSGITKHAHAIYNIIKGIIILFAGNIIAKSIVGIMVAIQELRLQMGLLKLEARATGLSSLSMIGKIRLGFKMLKLDAVLLKASLTLGLSLIFDAILYILTYTIKWENVLKTISSWFKKIKNWIDDCKYAWWDFMHAMSQTKFGQWLGWTSPYEEPTQITTTNGNSLSPMNTSNLLPYSSGFSSSGTVYNSNPNINISNQIDINGSDLSKNEIEDMLHRNNMDLSNQLMLSMNNSMSGMVRGF